MSGRKRGPRLESRPFACLALADKIQSRALAGGPRIHADTASLRGMDTPTCLAPFVSRPVRGKEGGGATSTSRRDSESSKNRGRRQPAPPPPRVPRRMYQWRPSIPANKNSRPAAPAWRHSARPRGPCAVGATSVPLWVRRASAAPAAEWPGLARPGCSHISHPAPQCSVSAKMRPKCLEVVQSSFNLVPGRFLARLCLNLGKKSEQNFK